MLEGFLEVVVADLAEFSVKLEQVEHSRSVESICHSVDGVTASDRDLTIALSILYLPVEEKLSEVDERKTVNETCDWVCTSAPITQCVDADGCCPSGGTVSTDGDCISPGGHIWSGVYGVSEYQRGTDVAIDASGTHLWSRHAGSSDVVGAKSIAVDPSGNVFVWVDLRGSMDWGGSPVTSSESNRNVFVVKFVVKLDSSGSHVWSKRFGNAGQQIAGSVALDASGNVVLRPRQACRR